MTGAAWLGNARGSAAVEFGLTAPVFVITLAGILGGGILLWIQLGLAHGAAMAARCASVNSSLCGTTTAVQSFASQQTYGVNPPATVFTVSVQPCGNQVTANYPIQLFSAYFGSLALTAEACFPK